MLSKTLRIALCLLTTTACAQSRRAVRQSDIGSTVSVAGLRVPVKAWEHYARARAASLAGRQQEFDAEAAVAFRIEANFAALYVLRASQEIRHGALQTGLEDVLRAREIEPGVAWSGVTLAGAYNSLHRYADASLVLQSLRAPESVTWQAAYESSRSAVGRGDVRDALYWSGLTLKNAPPDCPEAHLLRANALQLDQRPAEAARELRLYLAAAPADAHPEIAVAIQAILRASTTVASN